MRDFDVHDTIVDPITYQDLVYMAKNINPSGPRTLRSEFEELLQSKVEEALELFDEHFDDIYWEACPRRVELVRHPKWSETGCELLAKEIYQWLLQHEMWIDVCIYYNGKRMTTCKAIDGKLSFRYNGEPFIEEEQDPRDYFEYVANPHILSMSFEGPLYEALNSYTREGDRLEAEFSSLLARWGLYYELGHPWNLTVSEV